MDLDCIVIDDESGVQKVLAAFLEREGCRVDFASSGAQAEAVLGKRGFDLVFLDVFLGAVNGIELLGNLRHRYPQLMIVIITGQPDLEMVTEALRLGAFDFLVKPFSYQKIISITRRALASKQMLAEKEQKQAHLDAIFRSASDAIILVDREGVLQQSNGAALRLCGYASGHPGLEFAGCERGCQSIVRDAVRDGVCVQARRIECGRTGSGKRYLSVSASPVVGQSGLVTGAVAIIRDETHLVSLEKQLGRQSAYAGMIGRSSQMQRLYSLIEALTNVQTTVLVNGESGTGKELVAAALHYQGNRSDKPFVRVNCAALSEHLLESELFGHVRGAFTGAVSNKIGRFRLADGGTIFLDEIGDISQAMQIKLLRVLQEREFEAVGDSRPVRVDVRVIAATHQDLAEKVRQGTFRHDLYYRLNVVRLILPPLRERCEDIPLLVEHFIGKFNQKFERALSGVSSEVMELFQKYHWPGNVRELEHAIEHAAIMCKHPIITAEYLPDELQGGPAGKRPEPHAPEEVAPAVLTLDEALIKAGGNKAKAARLLGVSRRTLYNKLLQQS